MVRYNDENSTDISKLLENHKNFGASDIFEEINTILMCPLVYLHKHMFDFTAIYQCTESLFIPRMHFPLM